MVYPCLNREEAEKTSKHYIKQGAFFCWFGSSQKLNEFCTSVLCPHASFSQPRAQVPSGVR